MATNDPNLLYTAALARANMDPHLPEALQKAPLAQVFFDTAMHEVGSLGVDVATSIVSAVEQEIAEVAPAVFAEASEMVDMVAGAVGNIAAEIPFIGTIVSLVVDIWKGSQPDAASLAIYAAECQAALGQPVIGSGYVPATTTTPARGGVVTPADVFAPDPANTSGFYPDDIPRSSLGKALVGITEADETEPGPEGDAPLYHTAGAYMFAGAQYRALSGESKAGHIGPHRRMAYRALRRAMGSQNKDKGQSLWPIYMALLADDRNAGRLSGGFMVYLLGHYWRGNAYARFGGDLGWVSDDPTGANPRGDGSPGPYCGETGWHPYVHQIIQMVNQWNAAQASPATHALAAHLAAVQWPAPLLAIPPRRLTQGSKAKPVMPLHFDVKAKPVMPLHFDVKAANATNARRDKIRAALAAIGIHVPANADAAWWQRAAGVLGL